MTTAAARLPRRPTWPVEVAAGATLLALAVGMAVAVNVRVAAALVFVVLLGAIALLDLPLVIALWAALTVFSSTPPFGELTSATALVIIAAWVAHQRASHISIRAALYPHGRLLALIALLLVWLTLSLVWSQDVAAARSELVMDWYLTAGTVVVLLTSLRTVRDVRLVVVAIVVAVVAVVALALAGIGGSATPAGPYADPVSAERLQGVVGDPNFLAAFIVPAIVLSLTLRSVVGAQARALLVPATILLVIGLAATGSRGGILAALVVLISAVVVMRGRRAAVLAAGAVALIAAAAWFATNPTALDRLEAISEDRGSGREDLWIVARRVSADHPVGGVGLANFTVRSREYVRRPGALEYVELIVERPHVVHNTYLEMLAETGAVGLGLFLAVTYAGIASAVSAARRFERAGERALAYVSRGVLVAMLGFSAAATFISAQGVSMFWVLLVLGPILLQLAPAKEARRERSAAGVGRRLIAAPGVQ